VRRRALVVLVAALAAAAGVSAAASGDHALLALNILPPGEGPNLPDLTTQIGMYDELTPLRGNVTAADLTLHYKPETLDLGGQPAVRVEHPRDGVTISRDRFDVPHIVGTTRANTEFGAGWATAEDRGLYLQLLRGPARIAALDVPGYDAFSLALTASRFVPSAQTEAFLASQVKLAQQTARGRQLMEDVDAYIGGINAYFKQQGGAVAPYTRNDVIALGTLIGAVFGAGGGHEAQSAELLADLQQSLGAAKGLGVWNDLREQLDPEAPVTIAQRFPYEQAQSAPGPGNVTLDPGSLTPVTAAPTTRRRLMSNAILIGAKRSSNGHPIFVAGPQVGYYAPEILMEEDLHGGGLDARGVAFPGLGFYLQIGRGPDYAWSATSASNDVADEFAETLCGNGTTQYVYKGSCRDMGMFDAGTLNGQELDYRTTVHGPVVGFATSGGRKVAIALDRSTRGRELLGAIPFQVLSTGGVRTPQDFFRTMSQFELTFNWFYADSKHVAVYSSGRLPLRAAGVNPALPTNGNGQYDWRGWLAPLAHPHGVDPASGQIVNWNNKPATGFGAADDNWTYGSIHRVQLLDANVSPKQKLTPAGVVSAMNEAATHDLRQHLIPLLALVMTEAPAPSQRDAQALQTLQAWDGSRLDGDGDGKVDAPAAALMDAWWPRLAVAVLQPVLGPLTDELKRLNPISDDANPGGSSYDAGWYEYVDKDLRTLTGQRLHGVYSTRYCGNGDVSACAASLWTTLDAAVSAAPRLADATKERISFGAFLGATMRWTNRPTFQQVVVFRSHR
jgi:acyl-homoserine lactone acylase PvdQ